MKLWTDAVDPRGQIDARYTCDLDNSSPEFRWIEGPPEALSYALIAEDPDAPSGTFTHWVVYRIPPTLSHLPAGIPPQDQLPNGIRQGLNSFGKLGYAGPCPPRNSAHRYVFRLYALREMPDLPSRMTSELFLEAITPVILATAEISGRYQRMIERAG